MAKLEAIANEKFDGHLTIMKFATNWRVGFYIPTGRGYIDWMPVGKTFEEAALAALANPSLPPPDVEEQYWKGVSAEQLFPLSK
jgi:hypothetical protein